MEVSEITRDTAAISWTVEYVLEQQEYTLYYGVDENYLNLTSYSILGNADISVRNQQYNITLTGLTMGTDYYVFVLAQYGFISLYSDTISFRTTDNGKTYTFIEYLRTFITSQYSSNGASSKLQSGPNWNWTLLQMG